MVKVLLKYRGKAKEALFETDAEFRDLLHTLFGIHDPATVRVSICSPAWPDELLDVDRPSDVADKSKLIVQDIKVDDKRDSARLARQSTVLVPETEDRSSLDDDETQFEAIPETAEPDAESTAIDDPTSESTTEASQTSSRSTGGNSSSSSFGVFLNPDGSVIFDHNSLPTELREKFCDPTYRPTDEDRRALIDILHVAYTANSHFPHKNKGYDRMISAIFTKYPQLNGDDVVKSMADFRAKLRNKFKNYRKRHSEDISRPGAAVEGIPNYRPPVKKTAVEIRSELSSISEMMTVVPAAERRRLMQTSFPERRFLIAKTPTKMTTLTKLFPGLLTKEGFWDEVQLLTNVDAGAFKEKALANCEKLRERVMLESRCPRDRALWHLSFILGEDLEDLLEGRSAGIRVTQKGIWLCEGAEIEDPESDTDVRMIMWALAHAVFAVKFPVAHCRFGSVMYNQVCGFRMPQTKTTERILKKLV